ncbi:MAG: HAD family hydrolase [Lachnospiraceae bacterium]
MKYSTVIFDLDGTLLDTLDDLTDSVNEIMKRYDYPVYEKEQIRRFVGNGIRVLMQRALPKELCAEMFEECFLAFREYYTNHCMEKTRPYLGIVPLLSKLNERKIKMAIVSNKNDEAVKELADCYFKNLITTAIGNKQGVCPKPAPDTVFEAMKLLSSRKEETLYVGDSQVDMQTAVNAGIPCVLVDWGFRDRDELEKLGALAVIHTPEELINIIKSE